MFLDASEKFERNHKKTLLKVKDLEKKYETYSNEDLKAEFWKCMYNEKDLAIIREGVKRVVRVRAYDVQILGVLAINEGNIAEMKTGEGKTLVAAMAAIYNSRLKKGIHVVTVNDYLAKRDAELISGIADFFGVSVNYIIDSSSYEQKQEAYACDITYCSNNQVAFDYLRDNMVTRPEQKMQRGHYMCIIDEVDNILIDESRTPLIISEAQSEDSMMYSRLDPLMYSLQEDIHYTVDRKSKNVIFSTAGLLMCEHWLTSHDIITSKLFDNENLYIYHILRNLLKAHKGMEKEIDYVERNDEIIIVDEFTGRLAVGRRFSQGLHQALEAKEQVPIKDGSVTKACISYTNFFRLYEKLSGMTGTAENDREEFLDIYHIKVIKIRTNRPIIRKDELNIRLYRRYVDMIEDAAELIEESHNRNQPVLVCTATVRTSQELSSLLHSKNLGHKVLNAKNEEYEARIVAQAGRLGAITVSTNMAGRGTDISLGGTVDVDISDVEQIMAEKEECKRQRELVLQAGGLKVIIVGAQDSIKAEIQFKRKSRKTGRTWRIYNSLLS